MKPTHRIVLSFAAATLLAALVAAASLWAFDRIQSASETQERTAALIIRAQALLTDVIDAETGQRGFILTGDNGFLKSYDAVRGGVSGQLTQLRSLTSHGTTRKHLDALRPLLDARMAELAEGIALRRQDMTAAIAVVASGRGMRTMDAIRGEVNSIVGIEEGILAHQRADFELSMRRLFSVIIAICVMALLLAFTFAYLVYREAQNRVKDLVHLETQHLLGRQEALNTQLQQTNATLEISEEKLAITLNSIGDAVIATDAEGRVALLNPLAERLTGWTRAQAVNRPVEEIFHIISQKTRLPSLVPVRDTLAHNTTHGLSNHTILIARDGSECDIADSCAPIRTRAGQMVGAVLVFRDVTERTRLDQALQEKNAELESARSVADKANLAKSEFLSSMSHELRTPLSAILGFAQLMDSAAPQPSAAQKRSIDQILKAGWYLLDLINEILDLALIESGKLSLSMEPMSLAALLHECESMIEPQAQKRAISITFPQFDAPYFVNADRMRVKQIIVNLLSNAIKYNSVGGTVVVACSTDIAHRVRLSFTDTGAGLSQEQLAQLFQPFNRLGQAENGEEGTGIGLVVCRRLIELMGGAIGVDSTVGKGSVFWFELNLTAEPQPAAGSARPETVVPAQSQAGARLHTLLYVEDNPANLMLVEDLIARRADIRLLSALDGIRGVEVAHASRPDVILMDINLPGISGTEALHILAADPATARIPVIALSANAMPRDIEKGLAAGFFRYLTKPIKVKEFMATLDEALEFAQTRAAPAIQEEKIR